MPVKKFKPTTPSRREMTTSSFEEITRVEPEKSLTYSLKKHAGRNVRGKITVRHRGGGNRRLYRKIDFKRDKDGIPARVHSIEYDPNRSARIALLHYADGEKRYILAPVGLQRDSKVMSGPDADIRPGNCMMLRDMPMGTVVHNIEMQPGKGGQLARSAGASARLMAKEGDYALLRMPSGEQRMLRLECRATIGQIGNVEHENIVIGKAGRARWQGKRPQVRGLVMNPVDHPHGGGEGKAPIGRKHPVTPWGKPTLGYRTRKKGKDSDKYIVRRRK